MHLVCFKSIFFFELFESRSESDGFGQNSFTTRNKIGDTHVAAAAAALYGHAFLYCCCCCCCVRLHNTRTQRASIYSNVSNWLRNNVVAPVRTRLPCRRHRRSGRRDCVRCLSYIYDDDDDDAVSGCIQFALDDRNVKFSNILLSNGVAAKNNSRSAFLYTQHFGVV